MATQGQIIEKKDGKVYIKIEDTNHACEGCAAHALCGKKDCEDAQVILNDRDDLQIGDEVEIIERENILVKTSLLAYGIPLVFFAGGILLAALFPDFGLPKELIQFLTGCVFLVLGGIVGRKCSQVLARGFDKYFSINVKKRQ